MDDTNQEELIRLLARTAQQDRQSFHVLYDRVASRMFGLCRSLTGHTELAEEALQEAFIRIWHHAGEYHKERGSPLGWMMTIARYRSLDLLRSRKHIHPGDDDTLNALEDESRGPVDTALNQEASDALSGCLEELNDVQKNAIVLSYYRGFTHEELAECLSTPIGTVKSWIRRGLIALKRCLNP